MKKILFLLLFTVASYGQTLQNPTFGTAKLKQNVTDNAAAKVNVQAADGSVNTIAKTDLIDVLNFASAVNLPTTGLANKIYITNDDKKVYTWNGTIYQPLATIQDVENAKFNGNLIVGTGSTYGVLDISQFTSRISNYVPGKNSTVGVANGLYNASQNVNVEGVESQTDVNFETPVSNSVLKYPAPTVAGTYTLATTADVAAGSGSTVNTAFTQKTFAASMSVAHDPANPNFYIDITGNFSLSITGTQNGDSGIVNLNFAGTQIATLTATTNKIITGASTLVQVYFIHDSQGLKWYRDEINGNFQNAIDAGSVAVKNADISFESNNSAGGISRVLTTTSRVALENSNAQSQLGSSIASVFGGLTLTQGDFTKDKTTTVTVGVSNVNTQISFEGKTIAGKYVVKTRPANSYTVATLPTAVLNDEATVTDATTATTLTGGGTLTIPVWYNGTAWTKLGGGSGVVGSTEIIAQPLSQKLSRWYSVLDKTPSTATLAFVGDSTSDLTSNFISATNFVQTYNKLGFPLQGFNTANMPNYGSNGQTIAGFINDTGTRGLAAVAAANLDLVIFCYGINDIRQNQLTKDQLKANIITCVNAIKAGSPNTDIVLRMPNSFDVPTSDLYIKQGTYASLAEAAQAQSIILYNAYKELEFYWTDVHLFDTQGLIYGRTSSPTTPSVLHGDEIHPDYDIMIKYLVNNIIGYTKPFREDMAIQAIEASTTPWVIYPRVFELSAEFIKIGEGTLNSQGTGFAYTTVAKNDSYKISNAYRFGDFLSFGKGAIVVQNSGNTLPTGNDSRVDYLSTLPTNTLVNGDKVEIYRRISNSLANKRYLSDKTTYPYARRVKIGTSGTDFFRIDRLIDDNIITTQTTSLLASQLDISTADTIVLSDGTILPLTGSTFFNSGNTKQVNKTGSFAAYANTIAYLYGSRPYETLNKTSSATLVAGTVTINDALITTNSRILITLRTVGGTVGTYYTYTVAAGSAVITSQSATDTSILTYSIIN